MGKRVIKRRSKQLKLASGAADADAGPDLRALEAALTAKGGKNKRTGGRRQAELADFVRSLAAEANEAAKSFAGLEEAEEVKPKSLRVKAVKVKAKKVPRRKLIQEPDEDEDERRERMAAQACEDAEIVNGSSDEDELTEDDGDDDEVEGPAKKKKQLSKTEKEEAEEAASRERAARAQLRAESRREAKTSRKVEDQSQKRKVKAKDGHGADVGNKGDGAISTKVTSGKVWLGNIPFTIDKDALSKDFGKFGEIDRVHLPSDDTGRGRGFAHIHYKDEMSAQKVVLLDGIEYKGRAIKVRRRSPRRRVGLSKRKGPGRREGGE